MKHIIAMLVCLCIGLGSWSCNGKSEKAADKAAETGKPEAEVTVAEAGLGVDRVRLMKYVTCPKERVDSLLAIGDTVYAKTGTYTLDQMGLDEGWYNEWADSVYSDTIPLMVALFDTYDRLTRDSGEEEASAAFVWHDVAKMQIGRFFHDDGREATEEEVERVFRVVDSILDRYFGGSKYYMMMAVCRWLVLADYRLLDVCERLMDRYPSAEIRQMVHDDYEYLFATWFKFKELRFSHDWYSCLGLDLRYMLCDLIGEQTDSLKTLMESGADEQMVAQSLRNHACLKKGKNFRDLQNALEEEYEHKEFVPSEECDE